MIWLSHLIQMVNRQRRRRRERWWWVALNEHGHSQYRLDTRRSNPFHIQIDWKILPFAYAPAFSKWADACLFTLLGGQHELEHCWEFQSNGNKIYNMFASGLDCKQNSKLIYNCVCANIINCLATTPGIPSTACCKCCNFNKSLIKRTKRFDSHVVSGHHNQTKQSHVRSGWVVCCDW